MEESLYTINHFIEKDEDNPHQMNI